MTLSSANRRVSGRIKLSAPQAQLALILGITFVYIALFKIESLAGLIAPMIAIPVVMAGLFFGVKEGIVAGLLAIALNAALFATSRAYGWAMIASSWPGDLMVIVVGYVAGRLKQGADERVRALDELRVSGRLASMLNQITINILTPQDAGMMYQALMRDLVELFEADDCYITGWDEARKKTVPIAATAELGRPYSNTRTEPGETTITNAVLTAKKAIAIDNTLNSPHINPVLAGQFPSRSVLGIPLSAGDYKLGAALVAFNAPHHFTPKDLEHAEQVGKQITLAMWTVRQETEIKKRLNETRALSNIGYALSETERVGIGTVFQLIVDSAKELIPSAEQVVLHLVDDEQNLLIPQAVAGKNQPDKGKLNMQPGEGIAGQVIKTGKTISIDDAGAGIPMFKTGTALTFRSLTVAPVQSGQKRLGTLSIQSKAPYAFTENDVFLINTLGTQAAIAIENARLLENTQQALKEANALYQINQSLIASLDADIVLKDAVELLQKSFGYYYVQIYVADPDSGAFIMRAGSGEIGAQLKASGHRLAVGEGIVGYAAETNAAFFTNNVDDAISFIRNPLLPDTKSELVVPVKIENQLLGLLDIQQAPPGILTARDQQLVSAVADQLAIALQKAHLYADLKTSLEIEKNIRSQLMQNERLTLMGRLLASVSHELNNPLQAIQNALFLLKEEKGISSQGQQDLNIVLAESERMANMIERLRTTYRPTHTEDFQPTQVNKIIEDVHALIATHLRHHQVVFEFQPDPELPLIPALTDQLRQVTLNLFMNAIEAATEGGVLQVSTTFLKDTKEILMTVSDTGAGIAPDILPNIFDVFITNKPRGTGLGLTITHDIVMKHHGRITAENNPDKGATFKVWLPTEQEGVE